ncbi:MAG: tRNA uridine-5-carboxymethylaminomethyl(34) synthesis GTPase MnmE [Bacteroidota bacterium]
MMQDDTIVAISTPPGVGALGMIRLSGPEAVAITHQAFRPAKLKEATGHSLHYGRFFVKEHPLDEVVVSVFRAPRSFTKEEVVEISFHGSPYILRKALTELVRLGARLAEPGEFTQRAFLNGALDLAQAEAVADLIASSSAGAHQMALAQLRGGVSDELKGLREQLLNFTSLIELELDFGEEDVEFADRTQLNDLIQRMLARLSGLIDSFKLGNALKQGVPTVILGKPNAGKSTLLNALLNEQRAIVSDIPGTTRDVIEDRIVLEGIEFRLMDTAGVRETDDQIEQEGVRRSLSLAQEASFLLYVFDLQTESPVEASGYVQELDLPSDTAILLLGNKTDLLEAVPKIPTLPYPSLSISAKSKEHLPTVTHAMVEQVQAFAHQQPGQPLISNVRHHHALTQARDALLEVRQGLAYGLTGDLLTIDIRTALHHIGEITGEISTDEVLGNIFGKFCIGK